VLALLKSGVDVNTADAERCTLVWLAAANGHTETVQALVNHGCSLDTANKFGRTPLMVAAQENYTETLRALLKCGGRLDPDYTVNKDLQTPVWFAARAGNTEAVRTLCENGAHANIADVRGYTPLHIAAIYPGMDADAGVRRQSLIWTLVRECGVNPASLNRDGKKARDLVPPGSGADKLLEWLEELQTPKHTITARAKKDLIDGNANKRAASFDCALCLEKTKDDVVAIVPCGHRVCLECWANMRSHDTKNCPHCRAQILHGVPQKQWPDEHPLYARFGVEVGGAQEALRGRARRFCVEA
jgi:ankyrin repeat protein